MLFEAEPVACNTGAQMFLPHYTFGGSPVIGSPLGPWPGVRDTAAAPGHGDRQIGKDAEAAFTRAAMLVVIAPAVWPAHRRRKP